ncbi:SAP domain-containing protein [Ectothiorhodospira lacustris]|uniref:SAP domain-containing protein n=1 Tax=Ectothiorhodospira lacustris TaxID=2899127 RepID=UPI001EE7F33C|nr:SAP domain-containing protein [Ectothiorhodospira lacustris]MCG5500178.1 SAP domain-containing protein [Ectothiorhodospira lacustris]MCG5511323.1 SAP domain-containing protein [Ectothiorhodospira lacustris]MCG5523051.1 SAP domain-containing protein [Ectothiorhodospira lacustris]
MNLATVRYIAISKGIDPGALPKGELIRTIQITEGYSPCFGNAETGGCERMECHWHLDCLRISARRDN